ncbi:MAG: zinc ribbon domain-containing protein [Synergistaceae bacterium]|nr:zinc ribbon domain-containing protein [Synergistaceae bacterium]
MNHNHTCVNCGAPLEAGAEKCPYCGTVTPYGESMLEEKKIHQREQERKRMLENLPKIKFVSLPFMILVYIFTFFGYAPYWYATRIKTLNSLESESKLPKWAIAVYALLWCVMVIVPGSESDIGISESLSQQIFNVSMGLSMMISVWLAFITRNILQAHASNYIEGNVAVQTIAASGTMLVLFGPLYLQTQINRMLKMELLAPKI